MFSNWDIFAIEAALGLLIALCSGICLGLWRIFRLSRDVQDNGEAINKHLEDCSEYRKGVEESLHEGRENFTRIERTLGRIEGRIEARWEDK